ncbi:uncharacterized protein LOC127880256 [Dreissena polymorpha]|uniref:Mitochondria-eating protein C-terminal domain-containing protein n=1 Tax=Dreissena polymorpha TaxID=45954 RepID=A0A9D4QK99_DREPO|nr:uncharacterized protein LOC127880256 [Dreissena polymorpha]KAH3833565.1 hypothetical protein DPMN_106876 [Dreissena polymorpha]
MYLHMEKPIIVRYGEPKTPVKIQDDLETNVSVHNSPRLQTPDKDLVFKYLCRLQDGLKVKPDEATAALKQYRQIQGEIGRLQSTIIRPSRYPRMTSSLYMQEKNFKERTQKIIETKEKEIVELKQKVAQLSLRLSALVGTQVTEPSDTKSDLTDDMKPIRLAEDYRSIYDNEWQEAFEELKVNTEEAKVLVYLGKVTWVAFEFAKDMAEQQIEDLMKKEMEIIRIMSKPSYEEKERRRPIVSDGISPRKFERDETLQLLMNYRRCLARTSVPGVKQIFMTLMTRTPPETGGTITDSVRRYILKTIEYTYLMCIQDPPMHLEWVRFGDTLDREKFKPFSGQGTKVVGTVWPVVLQYQGGPVMSRGVADVVFGDIVVPKATGFTRYTRYN